jgi:hypothetical protein
MVDGRYVEADKVRIPDQRLEFGNIGAGLA